MLRTPVCKLTEGILLSKIVKYALLIAAFHQLIDVPHLIEFWIGQVDSRPGDSQVTLVFESSCHLFATCLTTQR